jgi:Putative peptidoglycan binding domain
MSTTALQAVAWPTLPQGRANDQVQTAQYLLREHGHQIVADNVFGPKTDAAVRAFQSAAHLTVDGIIGPRTWSALIVTVRRGSRGDAVRAVQGAGIHPARAESSGCRRKLRTGHGDLRPGVPAGARDAVPGRPRGG